MRGWNMRQVTTRHQPRPPEDPTFVLSVGRTRDGWQTTVTRRGLGRSRKDDALARFLSWYVVTDLRSDTVPTAQVRRDWHLAHQDVGLPCPQSRRAEGVRALLDSDDRIRRGRGCLRGVLQADEMYDDALASVVEVLT